MAETRRRGILSERGYRIIVGQYKTRNFKGMPRKLQVEFAGQLGPMYGFFPSEFSDEGRNPLELALLPNCS